MKAFSLTTAAKRRRTARLLPTMPRNFGHKMQARKVETLLATTLRPAAPVPHRSTASPFAGRPAIRRRHANRGEFLATMGALLAIAFGLWAVGSALATQHRSDARAAAIQEGK